MEFTEDIRSETLDDVVKMEFFQTVFCTGKFFRLVAQEDCTRVADRVDTVALAVDETCVVKSFLTSDFKKISTDLVFV